MNLDGRPLPCHMPWPGFEPGMQRRQASALSATLYSYVRSSLGSTCCALEQDTLEVDASSGHD